MSDIRLTGISLVGRNMRCAIWPGGAVWSCDLTGVDLRNAWLSGVFFRDSVLLDADLRGADLYEARFQGCILCGVDFRDAALISCAHFVDCDLQGAVFSSDAPARLRCLASAR